MDDVITLIQEVVIGHDEVGNEIIDTAERDLLCRVFGVNRNEFYQAATVDLQPEITVRLSDVKDYNGEKTARYNGVYYSIIRTYRDPGSFHHGAGMALNEIELILMRKIGDIDGVYLTDENDTALLTENSQFITVEA